MLTLGSVAHSAKVAAASPISDNASEGKYAEAI